MNTSLSILTVTLNSEATIGETMASLNCQSNQQFEHIVKDGGSIDKTLETVRSMRPDSRILDCSDVGIYDAFNQAVEFSTGEVIGFLNSDDVFESLQTLDSVNDIFRNRDIQVAIFGVKYFQDNSLGERRITRDWPTVRANRYLKLNGIMPPHPGVFFRRTLFEQVGEFDSSFRVSGDFEWLLRCMKYLTEEQIFVSDEYSTLMRSGGASANLIRSTSEDIKACLKNGVGIHTLVRKKLSKLRGFYS